MLRCLVLLTVLMSLAMPEGAAQEMSVFGPVRLPIEESDAVRLALSQGGSSEMGSRGPTVWGSLAVAGIAAPAGAIGGGVLVVAVGTVDAFRAGFPFSPNADGMMSPDVYRVLWAGGSAAGVLAGVAALSEPNEAAARALGLQQGDWRVAVLGVALGTAAGLFLSAELDGRLPEHARWTRHLAVPATQALGAVVALTLR